MIGSLEEAAHDAAIEDGVLSAYGSSSSNRGDDIFKSKKAGLRRGKWTTEEESYANRLIYEFKLGLLPLTDGTTLRTFLSKLLNCDPMRISKKFVGQNCIGKQVFRRRQQDLEKLSTEQIERSRKELSDLERRFLERVAQTNRTRTAPKDGRMAGFDEDGGFSPWMAQPDDADQGSHSSSGNGHRPHKDPILPQQRPMLHNTNGYNMSALSGIAGENIFMPGNYGASGTDASRFDDQGKIKSGRPSSLQNVNGNFYFDPANMSDYLKHQHSSGFPPRTDMNDMHNFEMPHVRTDMSSFGGRNPGSTSFPWFAPFGDPNAHDGADANNLNYTGYYEQNLKASASSVSLSEFAMSLWPSMNNLATAAEAVSSSSKSQSVSISPPEKNKVPGESVAGKKLGSLSRMDSLSNVALNELEAIATNEADNKSKPKTETSSGSEGKVKIEGAILYDVGYNIDDGNNTLSASKPRMENNEDKSLDVTVRSEGKLTEKLPEMPVRGKIQVPGSASKIPFRHNSSVENFWMLVNMGDLPQPENDVLSETLTSKIRKTTENDSTAGRSGHSSGSRKRSAADSVDGGSCANSVGIDSLPVSSMDLNYNTVLKSMKQESMLPHSANAGTNVPSDEFIFSSTMKNLYFPPTSSDSVAVQVGSTAEQKN